MLELSSIPTDKAVFVPKLGSCSRVLRLLVDYFIGRGNDEFNLLTDANGRRFEVKPKVSAPFEFAGVFVE